MAAVLLDVDGVLADFKSRAFDDIVRLGGPRLTSEDLTHPMIQDRPDVAEVKDALLDLWHQEGFCRSLEPYPGSKAAVEEIRKHRSVVFVTSAMHSKYWHWERVEWLKEHYEAKKDDVIFADQKVLVSGDLLVDDTPKHVFSWSVARPSQPAFLWAHPYNRNVSVPTTVTRTNDWNLVIAAARAAAEREAEWISQAR